MPTWKKIGMGMGSALAVLALAVAIFTPGAGRYPTDEGMAATKPDPAALAYFESDYESSRAAFRGIAGEVAARYQKVESGSLKVPSPSDDDLTMDYVLIPAQRETQRLIILTCGTHGSEGPAGAAVMRHFLKTILPARDLSTTGVLAIHAINPYGFKYFRRVSENNVDLNRNFDLDDSLFETKNEGYAKIFELLNPAGPADADSLATRYFFLRAIYNIAVSGMAALRQAALQGQYEFENGIYFGGQAFEPQKALLEPLLLRAAGPYRAVLFVDLHTGYGERGTLHLFPNAAASPQIHDATEAVFAGYAIDWGDPQGEFYSVHGEFSDYANKLLGDRRLVIPMVYEYGTMDSQTTGGAVESIHRMILENQGHQHGYAGPEDEAEIRQRFREMFYPSSPVWRTKIVRDSAALWPSALDNFERMP